MNLVVSIASLLGIGIVLYGPWQTHWEDWGRQRLFEVRDRIFDLASEGRMDFRDRRYVTIRNSLNQMIRFAHELTWVRLIYFALMVRGGMVALRRPSSLEMAVEELDDPEIKAVIEAEMIAVAKTVGMVVVMRSPLLIAVVVPVLAVMLLFRDFARLVLRRGFEFVQRESELVDDGLACAVVR